ncbi:MAG: 4-(cytidine 5'-diphospho)-2-C-methyl-D-erythritol kinase, partial [Treponema sp.]|nr:4-(cytidine 5'-diphospho)-2-C-methyl-D-erythritol kinase [Treponema sp.]
MYDTLHIMRSITLMAPAKLNLHLRIGGGRPDGFHGLESIFVALAFGDTLRVECLPQADTLKIRAAGRFACGLADTPAPRNLVGRAAALFRERTGFKQGLRARLVKRIPLGGGLGGGSSDAAAMLLALNILSAAGGGVRLDDAELAALGAALGSDVPFFLANTPAAWVSGRGERIQPIAAPSRLWFVLVNPGIPSGTQAAFRLLDEYRARVPGAGKAASLAGDSAALIGALAADPCSWPFENDFLPVLRACSKFYLAGSIEPKVRRARKSGFLRSIGRKNPQFEQALRITK